MFSQEGLHVDMIGVDDVDNSSMIYGIDPLEHLLVCGCFCAGRNACGIALAKRSVRSSHVFVIAKNDFEHGIVVLPNVCGKARLCIASLHIPHHGFPPII